MVEGQDPEVRKRGVSAVAAISGQRILLVVLPLTPAPNVLSLAQLKPKTR